MFTKILEIFLKDFINSQTFLGPRTFQMIFEKSLAIFRSSEAISDNFLEDY